MKLLAFLLTAATLSGCARQASTVPSEFRWQENGWIACPGQPDPLPDPAKPTRPNFRTGTATTWPADLPESWRQTLYHDGQTIAPIVVLNGKVVEP